VARELRSRPDAELRVRAREVHLDRVDGHEQGAGARRAGAADEPADGSGGSGSSANAALKGTATTARGVTFVVTMPAAGRAKITLFRARAGKKASAAAAKYKRVGVVRKTLRKGRNVVKVKRIKKRKLARGRYRATIAATAAGQKLTPLKVNFTIRK
jgi:hypothetical protein